MCQPTLFSAHSASGMGGLQFARQPFSTGTNGAGKYGMSMLLLHGLI